LVASKDNWLKLLQDVCWQAATFTTAYHRNTQLHQSLCWRWLQVHLARLKSGERVVVKVQRPGLKDLFDIDLKNIRWAAVAAATMRLDNRSSIAVFMNIADRQLLPSNKGFSCSIDSMVQQRSDL
jgi:hypothetical protein